MRFEHATLTADYGNGKWILETPKSTDTPEPGTAHSLCDILNGMGAQGWTVQTDTGDRIILYRSVPGEIRINMEINPVGADQP